MELSKTLPRFEAWDGDTQVTNGGALFVPDLHEWVRTRLEKCSTLENKLEYLMTELTELLKYTEK